MDNQAVSALWSCASATCLSLDAKRHSIEPNPDGQASPDVNNNNNNHNKSTTTVDAHSRKLRHIAHTPRGSCFMALLLLLLLALNFRHAHSCGPGRGLGRRRERNLFPLVLKQTVPNLSEYHNSASGPLEGAIQRDSPKFKNLVLNYNRDIEFRDEEGTGADRVMSKRCREKLNMLAYSVMNEWPGVRLRVTESWDEDRQHGQESLHYEGRAVTIATSDHDQSKYGMLARLAVEAGFDWVSYVSRRHIYCSVKSDSSPSISHMHGCFTPESTALLESGAEKALGELAIGDRVLSMDVKGQPVYSEVILFMDRNLEQVENFVQLHTDGGAVLTVTPAHLISVWQPERQTLNFIFADRVEELDYVLVRDATGELQPQRVLRLGSVQSRGVVAPLTREGTIVVNSVAASCYAVISSQSLAHWGLAPMRLLSTLQSWMPAKGQLRTAQDKSTPKDATAQQQNGLHWYANALYKVKDYVLPKSWRHD
uniref:Protein hedgehog n=1 Tax=Drosophila hydei TaxID=7224 RepID=HH_DROHY|nr:RecName: Full=Protein hedgehog; Contains: RecName: Full=Protein hedgehog N-product; Flags: Precursor [Drosophila hydei]AAB34104.1 hedgehog hh protein homolog [Drosophila hydei, Peptide, 481 aa] [Drosophila hydei]